MDGYSKRRLAALRKSVQTKQLPATDAAPGSTLIQGTKGVSYSGPTTKIAKPKSGRARGVYVTNKTPGPTDGSMGAAFNGTCPGATAWCAPACYAVGPARRYPNVAEAWSKNADAGRVGAVQAPPKNARMIRIHGSGDLETEAEIYAYIGHAKARPEIAWWAYTRSWRVAELLPALQALHSQPNVQLFASMDPSITETPPDGWRVAWIEGDDRAGATAPVYDCPEQNGRKADCIDCGYCITGRRNDVRFSIH